MFSQPLRGAGHSESRLTRNGPLPERGQGLPSKTNNIIIIIYYYSNLPINKRRPGTEI